MAAIVETVFEVVVRDGIKYLVKKATDSLGKAIRQFFRDEDDDGQPDTEEPEFTEVDEQETSGEGESETENPPATTSDQNTYSIGDIVLVTPDGPVALYADTTDSNYDLLVSQATDYWLQTNGAMDKPLKNYSVTEALLFIIATGTVISLICKLFKRRKM